MPLCIPTPEEYAALDDINRSLTWIRLKRYAELLAQVDRKSRYIDIINETKGSR